MTPLTVTDALREAAAAGVDARLMVCLRPRNRRYLVGVTTSDPEPRLELVVADGRARRVEELWDRTQSGPERWDYRMRLDELREVYVVRLQHGDQVREVPLLPAEQAVVHAHGWSDEAFAHFAEPLVERVAFRRALGEVVGGEGDDLHG